MTTQICLVSAQAAANLLPALDPQLQPDHLILVVSPKMKPAADHLATVLSEGRVRVEQFPLTNEHDFPRMEAELLELASLHEGKGVALNITGGTKLMSLAAQSVAAVAGWKMFYVDVDTDRVTWLYKDAPPPHALSEHLRLRHYLGGYGFRIDPKPIAPPQPTHAQQTLMDTLVRQLGSLEGPLSQLNWLAQQAEDKRQLKTFMNEAQQDSRHLEALLRNFSDAGCLTVQGASICFPDEAARNFVKGGWLEAQVYGCLNTVSGELGIRDKAANLQVIDDQGVRNELDVAFMARNRLFVIECKTARMDKPEAPKANETLFKLAQRGRDIGGLGTHKMLISYRALRDTEKKLAGVLGIKVVSGADILRLPEALKNWVSGNRPA